MRSAAALAFLLLATAGAAGAQPPLNPRPITTLTPEGERLPLRKPGFTLPVTDYVAPDGSLQRRRGVVAGFDVGPQALFGVGFFERAPKRQIGAPDPTKSERKSRRAAVGLSLSF